MEKELHIITMDDQDFPELLELLKQSDLVGSFSDEGGLQLVRANKRLVMVSPISQPGSLPDKIAVQAVRTQKEAYSVAQSLINEES